MIGMHIFYLNQQLILSHLILSALGRYLLQRQLSYDIYSEFSIFRLGFRLSE